MALPVEDPKLRREALVYVIRLYDELTEENGAPTLGQLVIEADDIEIGRAHV